MEMDEQRDSNPDGMEMNMDMDEQRDLKHDELAAIQALVELARVTETGYFVTWGRKRPRSRGVYIPCNSADATTAAARVKPEAAACASPTTPLRWSGNDTVSAPRSTSSDTAAAPAPRPCERPLKLKVGKKLGVHKPPIGKGPKKKTLAELKELFIGLSSNREEMEKEKEKLLNKFQSLRDDNMILKRELALKLSTKGEPQLLAQSPTVSLDLRALESSNNHVENSSLTAAVDLYSSVEGVCHSNDTNWVGKSLRHESLDSTKSSSHAFALPDLNMSTEDEHLSENHVVQTNSKAIVAAETNSKAIVAAEARKYRMECRRLKHSQSVKFQIK